MPHTNADIFREKGAKNFSKKSVRATEFDLKMSQK
jgi:hypothetical protein